MLFSQRLFAVYYLMLIKLRRNKFLRHMNRGGTEDFGAVCFVFCSQLYILFFIAWVIKKIGGFETTPLPKGLSIPSKMIICAIMGIWLYFSSKYFIGNRERRNKFIDNFRSLNSKEKTLWNIIGSFLMFIPLWLLLYVLVKGRFYL